MAAHAILSPSGAERWLTCTPSARLEEKFPESTSTYAEEGTLAHEVAELILRDEPDFKKKLDALKKSERGKKYYSDALYGHADEFAEFVRRNCTGEHFLFVEQKLNVSKYIPEGFGTGDAIVFKEGEMFFDDLKYGQGVKVSAVNNKQLMIYALGALDQFGFMYDITHVTLSIFQPRLDNVTSWRISVKELYEWAEKELAPKAKLAWEGKGDMVAGEHCRFCKVGAQCRALADYNLELAAHEFFGQDPHLLSTDEIASLISRAETVQLWVKLLQEHALKKALAGEKVKGYKLVEGRSVRKYTDKEKVIKALVAAGFEKDKIMTQPELLGITALEKVVKKEAFRKHVEPTLEKPPGNPTLVPETDPRKEWNDAEMDFADDLK